MVIGGEQHIKARVLYRVDQRIGAVEGGVALIGVIIAAEGGFQIGNGVVQSGHGILDIAENGGKIVASVALAACTEYRLMHQQVAHGAHGGGGDHLLRLRRFRGGGFRFFRFCGGRLCLGGMGQLHGVSGGGHVRFFVDKIDAQINQERCGGDHQHDEHRQHHDQGSVAALGIFGHFISSL